MDQQYVFLFKNMSELLYILPCWITNPHFLLQIKNMWAAFPPDVAGNVDYKNICYVITHGEEKEE